MRTLPVNDERELLLFHVKGTGEVTVMSPTTTQIYSSVPPRELRYLPADLGQVQTDESRTNNGTTEGNETWVNPAHLKEQFPVNTSQVS